MTSPRKIFKQIVGDLRLALQRKWEDDCLSLPLTDDHRQLYKTIHRLCWQKLGEFPDLVTCRDFNDRVQWLKLFDHDREMIRCVDKVRVRDFVRECVGEQYLVKLYQVHDHFSQIDFNLLPSTFVIKTNHDSGTVFLVRDGDQLDMPRLERQIDAALKKPYGRIKGEWAYLFVQPKVLVEEFVNPEEPSPPPDYKFYCVEGKVRFCHYIYDRGPDTKEQTVDPDGNDLATALYPKFKLGTDFKRPDRWREMIHVAERLSYKFKCVRVDMFCTEENIYVGEMTFWPMGGHYKGEGQKKLGQLLDFDRTTHKPFLLPELESESGPLRL